MQAPQVSDRTIAGCGAPSERLWTINKGDGSSDDACRQQRDVLSDFSQVYME